MIAPEVPELVHHVGAGLKREVRELAAGLAGHRLGVAFLADRADEFLRSRELRPGDRDDRRRHVLGRLRSVTLGTGRHARFRDTGADDLGPARDGIWLDKRRGSDRGVVQRFTVVAREALDLVRRQLARHLLHEARPALACRIGRKRAGDVVGG